MAKKKFSWKPGYRHKINADIAGKEIERLKKKWKSKLTTKVLAEEAKEKENPLHLEIYDKAPKHAAKAYYLMKAGQCLRCIEIEIVGESKSKPVRAFHPVIIEREEEESNEKIWCSTEEAMADPNKREQILEQAKNELRQARNKYSDLKELASIWKVIDACV